MTNRAVVHMARNRFSVECNRDGERWVNFAATITPTKVTCKRCLASMKKRKELREARQRAREANGTQ